MKFKNESGRSMMEMILYLGLIVVLTASTLKMYADSVEKTRVIKAENQVADIKEGLNTYFLGRTLEAGTTFGGFISAFTESDANALADPWGGKVSLDKAKIGENDYYFNITYGKGTNSGTLDQKRCITIGNVLIAKGAVAVGISAVPTSIPANPPSISDLATGCKASGNYVAALFEQE